jgi:hypothetical protein
MTATGLSAAICWIAVTQLRRLGRGVVEVRVRVRVVVDDVARDDYRGIGHVQERGGAGIGLPGPVDAQAVAFEGEAVGFQGLGNRDLVRDLAGEPWPQKERGTPGRPAGACARPSPVSPACGLRGIVTGPRPGRRSGRRGRG